MTTRPASPPLRFGTSGGFGRLVLLLTICAFLVACASTIVRTETSEIDIVGLGTVRLTIQVPPGFTFTRLSDAFMIAPSTGRVYTNSLHVFVTPSMLLTSRPLPGGKRVRRPFAGIPAWWWIYDRMAGGRHARMADLFTGIDDCTPLVRVSVVISGDEKRKIDALMRAAAKMSIEARVRLADAEAVTRRCAGPDLTGRP